VRLRFGTIEDRLLAYERANQTRTPKTSVWRLLRCKGWQCIVETTEQWRYRARNNAIRMRCRVCGSEWMPRRLLCYEPRTLPAGRLSVGRASAREPRGEPSQSVAKTHQRTHLQCLRLSTAIRRFRTWQVHLFFALRWRGMRPPPLLRQLMSFSSAGLAARRMSEFLNVGSGFLG
jgi:hypothetical protein